MFLPSRSLAPDGDCAAQVAALCWRLRRAGVQVLLITSRDTGRWVLPKGWVMEGRSPAEAAAREAWEEAGVKGTVAAGSIGHFHYDKLVPGADPVPCRVEVFGLSVTSLAAKYPERKQRRRRWFAAQEAAQMVNEPELRALLVGLGAGMGAESAAGPLAAGADQDHIKG
ncbi:MAG: NUDIX hydrolase [Paracoccaceae bacterium]